MWLGAVRSRVSRVSGSESPTFPLPEDALTFLQGYAVLVKPHS